MILFILVLLGILAVVLLVIVIAALLKPRSQAATDVAGNQGVEITALEVAGPPEHGPVIEFYSTPVRLAVFVLAPAGRGGQVPSRDALDMVVEDLVPGLYSVLSAQQPIFRFWPQQLSSAGFTQSFFNKMPLPGERGKGTPWCSIAGKFNWRDGQLLVGMVFCADRPTGLSQVVVQHEGQWHDVLRIRNRP